VDEDVQAQRQAAREAARAALSRAGQALETAEELCEKLLKTNGPRAGALRAAARHEATQRRDDR
jgi:hypothetical protein